MRKASIFWLLTLTVAALQAQEGKTIHATQGSVIVVEKLPITLVVNGDTLVVGDIGIRDARSPLAATLLKKRDRSLHHFTPSDKDFTWFSVDDDDKGEKKVRVHVETLDEDEPVSKKVRVREEILDDSEHPGLIIIDEDDDEASDSTADKEHKIVVMKKVKRGNEDQEEKSIRIAVQGEGIHPVIGLGLLLQEKEGQVKVHRILTELAPKDQPFKEGDQLIEIEGKSIKTLSDFDKKYDPIDNGKTVRVKVKRNNTEQTLSFSKPEDKGEKVIIKKMKK